MIYTKIAMCIVGMSLYFNAGKIEARGGAADHSILWAALSLLTSLFSLWAGAGWVLWLFAQIGLLIGIAVVRVLLDRDAYRSNDFFWVHRCILASFCFRHFHGVINASRSVCGPVHVGLKLSSGAPVTGFLCFSGERMNRVACVCQMAEYNRWMNSKICSSALNMTHSQLVEARNAFFGSILETLNHLLIADTIWLKRFATHPAQYPALLPVKELPMPNTGDLLRFSDLQSFTLHRHFLDTLIHDWANSVSETDFDYDLKYTNSLGITHTKNFFALAMHFFNHQTHHRGQISTLFSQSGIDIGVTDLVAIVAD
jgi:uncharacterized damage-inducible protein DinB